MKKILVTGGLGYIGAHTVVALQEAGFSVKIIDDLSNTSVEVLNGISKITGKIPEFEKLDLRDKQKTIAYFKKHKDIDGIIHFAASKAVGESVHNPLLYYENNVSTLISVLQQIEHYEYIPFIFSSSCTVYGQAETLPISEEAPTRKAFSPYGNTKQIGEEILQDTAMVRKGLQVCALRYFNPIGAHPSAEIGELPNGVPLNLVPFITQTAIGIRKELAVFGNDYPTKDGTCIRDYIHVTDLAEAHVAALQRILNRKQKQSFEVFNIGTGKGSSVLEVIESFERVTGEKLNYKIADRRAGDVTAAYADTTKANTTLGWKASSTLDEAMQSAWKWERKIRKNKD